MNSSGYIEMPVLGLVEAQRRTTSELARQITKGLQDEEYLNTPSVWSPLGSTTARHSWSRVRFAIPESFKPKGDHR